MIVLALVLHGVVGLYFLYLMLVVPAPILLLLWIGWGGLLWVVITQRKRPLLMLLVPVADAILWLALVPGLYYFFEWKV